MLGPILCSVVRSARQSFGNQLARSAVTTATTAAASAIGTAVACFAIGAVKHYNQDSTHRQLLNRGDQRRRY